LKVDELPGRKVRLGDVDDGSDLGTAEWTVNFAR
jgi:hypothetical protein